MHWIVPLLSPRSNTRHPSIIRPCPPHMTKTSPPLNSLPNLAFNYPRHPSHYVHPIYSNWRLRRTKPNPTMKNPSVLLNRSHRLNNSYYNLQPHHSTSQSNSIYPNNNHNLHTIHNQLKIVPPQKKFICPNSQGTQNMILFANRIFTEVMSFKWGH